MSAHEHRAHAPADPLRFAILTVSTSRSPAEDRSGDAIEARVREAGHQVVERRLVSDDVDAIRGAVREIRITQAQVLVITGGTGVSARDLTPEAIRSLFTRELPGFGELFRWLSFQEIGAAAMLSRATGGVIGELVTFAVPGSTAACALAMDKLILPEVAHLVGQIGKETASLVPAATRVDDLGPTGSARLSLSEPTPTPAPADAGADVPRWRQAIAAMGGRVESAAPPPLPEAIEKLAPVTSLLDTAGERATLVFENGRRLGLYGWPDLARPASKVLAVGDGAPLAEVIALHRHPRPTGTSVQGGVLPNPGGAGATAEAITGRAPRTTGPLFAISGDTVWIRADDRAIRCDGRTERDDGSCKQVLATLMLEWTQR